MSDILVMGSCIVDVTAYVDRFPREGESLVAERVTTNVGGKASNQAIAVSRLGAPVSLVTRIGTDSWADYAREIWQQEGVNQRFVVRDPEVPTGMGLGIVRKEDAENVTISDIGASGHLSISDVDEALNELVHESVVLIHLNAPSTTIRHVLGRARERGATTVLNVSPVGDTNGVLGELDVAVLNAGEASAITGSPVTDVRSAALATDSQHFIGVKATVITLGGIGLVMSNPNGVYYFEAFPVFPLDTTGAGDAFCGALGVAILSGRDLGESVRFASAAAAICVTNVGTWQSLPVIGQVDRFLSRHPSRCVPTRISSRER